MAFLKVQVSLEDPSFPDSLFFPVYCLFPDVLFNKTRDFEYCSKCEYVHVEINSHNEDAAILAFARVFLLELGMIKSQVCISNLSLPWHLPRMIIES